ncbi:MYXO-CTERM sorting domain-containing protein [Streptomyces prunicolor]
MGPTAIFVIIRSVSSCTSAGPPTVTSPLYVMAVSLVRSRRRSEGTADRRMFERGTVTPCPPWRRKPIIRP